MQAESGIKNFGSANVERLDGEATSFAKD